MHWNEALYLYHLNRGGTCLGPWEGNWYSQLLLDHKGQPLVIRGESISNGRIDTLLARAILPLELEHPYQLTISRRSPLNRGVNLVLGREDFGYSELSQTRRIRSENIPFTKQVLRHLELRQALEQCPTFALSVSPATAGLGRAHMLEVHGNMSAFGNGVGDSLSDSGSAFPFGLTREELQQYVDAGEYDIGEFQARLDGMIALAVAACDALTSWPMPPM
ncbi:MAG: hypothetical protein AB7E30_01515 [Lawsonibacter sp.]